MPWLLTTPLDTGSLDVPYAEIKMTRFFHDSLRRSIDFSIEYGNTVDQQWVPGFTPRDKQDNFMVDGAEYFALVMSSFPRVFQTDPLEQGFKFDENSGLWIEGTYFAVKRSCYEWLAAQGHIGPGTII